MLHYAKEWQIWYFPLGSFWHFSHLCRFKEPRNKFSPRFKKIRCMSASWSEKERQRIKFQLIEIFHGALVRRKNLSVYQAFPFFMSHGYEWVQRLALHKSWRLVVWNDSDDDIIWWWWWFNDFIYCWTINLAIKSLNAMVVTYNFQFCANNFLITKGFPRSLAGNAVLSPLRIVSGLSHDFYNLILRSFFFRKRDLLWALYLSVCVTNCHKDE